MNFFQSTMHNRSLAVSDVSIECIKDFYRPLEDLRIIFLSLLAGGFVLLYLDQGRDVVRGLGQFRQRCHQQLAAARRRPAGYLAVGRVHAGLCLVGDQRLVLGQSPVQDRRQGRSATAALVSSSCAEASAYCHCWPQFFAMPLERTSWHLGHLARDAVLCGRSRTSAVVLRLSNHLVHCRKGPEDLQGGRSQSINLVQGDRLVHSHDDRDILR